MNQAEENLLDIGKGMKLWYRTWGNTSKGIPVLFVHGGPDGFENYYNAINEKLFDKYKFYVIEVDQRGAGKSQPSVRDDYKNMKLYTNISIIMYKHISFRNAYVAVGVGFSPRGDI